MGRSAAAASFSLPFELVVEDGIPMEDIRHSIQMRLLIALTGQVMEERGRQDYCAGGDNFVYYSVDQARDVVEGRPYFRGPDFFLVDGVPPRDGRKAWVSWEEGGRLPDLIVEMLSPSTAHIDRKDKKDLYARVFRTPEYYLYDFDTGEFEGLRRAGDVYRPIPLNAQGRFRSEVLGLDLGLWRGVRENQTAAWIRFFHPDGRMVPTPEERNAAADRRIEEAEAELRRLRSLLGGSAGGA